MAAAAQRKNGNEESWVEIESQPSSSSLSSMNDEIVTTGLRIGNAAPPRRRRLHQQPQQQQQQPIVMPPTCVIGHAAAHAGTSSQEEYDETESEEDRVMTSSTEVNPLANLPQRQQTAIQTAADTDSDSDDDENATALGRPTGGPSFHPQPNAFSHPPSHLQHRHSTSSAHPFPSRASMASRHHTRTQTSRDYMSPSFQADNDAALRASLTTLLSCAAAARGLSQNEDHRPGPSGLGVGVQPMELRLVPESELMTDAPPPAHPRGGHTKIPTRTASNSSAPSGPTSEASKTPDLASEKTKRAGTPQTKSARAIKKKRTAVAQHTEAATFINPTLMTWVVSAGVVVLVSVVGFGAGYVIGREVGRQEGGALLPSGGSNASSGCGRELARSSTGTLRRFRWGSVGKSVTA